MADLELHGVAVALGGRDVVRAVSAEVSAGELIVKRLLLPAARP